MSDTATQVQSILNKSSLDKFRMILNLPPILLKQNTIDVSDRSDDSVNLNSLQFSVYGAVVPASYVPHTDVRFGGQAISLTTYSRPTYPNINVGFSVDNGFNNYFVLWKWLQLLNDERKSVYNGNGYSSILSLPNKHQYMTDLNIISRNEYNKDIVKFTYTNSFITRLEGIDYDHRNPEIIDSKFEFAFSQFYMEKL
ncbi:MAG: hypothetical protein LC127_13900 [Chitinophagales bacterium]|nr:hypothetical protein [Chitinophagales bacterium]